NKAPQTIEERVKETMRRTEHCCRIHGLIYLGVDFTTSLLGNAPPRSKQQPKGKGKGKEGESSTTQEEAPESPPSAAPEQVVTLASPEKGTKEDVPIGPSTQDVGTATTTE
ncbi:hypothetical protein KI387_021171, partial [Taxus chinensis]